MGLSLHTPGGYARFVDRLQPAADFSAGTEHCVDTTYRAKHYHERKIDRMPTWSPRSARRPGALA